MATLFTSVLAVALIGCAGAKTAQSTPQLTSSSVGSSAGVTLAQAQTDPRV